MKDLHCIRGRKWFVLSCVRFVWRLPTPTPLSISLVLACSSLSSHSFVTSSLVERTLTSFQALSCCRALRLATTPRIPAPRKLAAAITARACLQKPAEGASCGAVGWDGVGIYVCMCRCICRQFCEAILSGQDREIALAAVNSSGAALRWVPEKSNYLQLLCTTAPSHPFVSAQ